MLGLLAFGGLLMGGFAVMAVMSLVFLVLRVAFWVVFLPFRILFKSVWLPIGLIGGVFSLVAGAAILPVLLTVGVAVAAIAAIAAILALLVPAIPFVLLGLIVWAFVRRPAVAA